MSKRSVFCVLLIGFAVLQATAQVTGATSGAQGVGSATQGPAGDIVGTWSGTFFQPKSKLPAFTITIVIDRDASGHLVAKSSQDSSCVKDSNLQVTVKGRQVVIAGSDDEGNNMTLRGKVDAAGSLLSMKYIINGGASGRCESDIGTGSMAKR
jgi:hypothetical protein